MNARIVAVAALVSTVLAVRAVLFGTDAAVALYYLVGFGAAAVAWYGAARQPATVRRIARPVALGVTLSVLGDAAWWAEAQIGMGGLGPSDVLNLAGYASLGLGLLRASARGGRSRQQQVAGSIDALVVFVAVVAVLWQFAMAQVVSDASLPLASRLVWAVNPALDAALIALVLRLLTTGVRRPEGPVTIAVGAGAWLVADIGYLVDAQFRSGTAWLGTGWLLGLVLVALSCGMNRSSTAGATPLARDGMGRLAVCLGALLVPAAMEAYVDLSGAEEAPGLVLVATAVLTALVFVRTSLLVAGEARARARLRSQQRYSAALAAHSSDGVVVLGRDGRLLSDLATLPDMLQVDGGGEGDMDAVELIRRLGGDPREAHVMFERAVLAAGEVVDAELLCERGGVAFWLGIRAADLTDDPDVGGVVIHVTDISDRKRAEEALAHQAFHDALTGLANRALFADRVEQALRRGVRGQGQPAVVFIDLDGFKGVNDTLGHPAGDALLREVARRLRSVVRLDDTVSRLGGDEFAVLVEQAGSGPEEAVATAERVLGALAVPFTLERQTVTISGSVGIAVAQGGTTGDSLIGDADIAMYAAKMAGRGRSVVFDSGMRDSAVAARELEQALRGALAAGEFRLVYQPVIDLGDDSVTGFEALLRWNSALLGPVPPDRFVPVAEASGLIESIGAWALREACATAAAWRAEHGRDLTMAVNVSAVQLTSAHLVEHITEALDAAGLPSSALVLEVTETALVADPERASECLAALRALGVRLALDDFGTGYSSLAHLRQFTVDVLKIDRSFVATIGEDGVMPPIVRGMIDLGRTLGLEIVAEGVETDAQRRLLVEGRCDLAQGYLFARPLERADASLLLVAAAAPAGA